MAVEGAAHASSFARLALRVLVPVTMLWGSVAAMTVAAAKSGPAGRAEAMFINPVDGTNWPGYGRLYDEQHFRSLTQVNTGTVGRLGLAWWADLPPASNPATAPLAVDGVIYISYGLSVVHAYDGALVPLGMPSFADRTPAEAEAIRHYIRSEAQK